MSIDTTDITAAPVADIRNLVTVETVVDVRPIENADAIEAITVRGWTLVAKKGEFVVGDPCVYFELDSALPLTDPRFEFLAARSTKMVDEKPVHVLKTARLRGVYSQGLALPLADFPEVISVIKHTEMYAGDVKDYDLANLLGIFKYEPPLPANLNAIGLFPSHLLRKTDSERVQNLTAEYADIVAAGPWIATEKVDGTSLTVLRDADGTLRVAQRNYELAPPEENQTPNLYWAAVLNNDLGSMLAPNTAIQAEIAGPGIQGNPLGLPSVKVVIFSYLVGGEPQPRSEWPTPVSEDAFFAPVYDIDLPDTVAGSIEQVEKIRSLVAAQFKQDKGAEGVVWHRENGQPLDSLVGRSNFKSLSNKYLTKHDR
jgi:RNA ligase (TIGR02306 family)